MILFCSHFFSPLLFEISWEPRWAGADVCRRNLTYRLYTFRAWLIDFTHISEKGAIFFLLPCWRTAPCPVGLAGCLLMALFCHRATQAELESFFKEMRLAWISGIGWDELQEYLTEPLSSLSTSVPGSQGGELPPLSLHTAPPLQKPTHQFQKGPS